MDITNKSKRPLKIPLPGGKLLRLGPGRTGQITPKAAQHPPLKALVEAGDIEIAFEGKSKSRGDSSGGSGPSSAPGHSAGGGMRHTGDR